MEEIWRPVKDFEGHYEVSNLGNIRTITRMVEQRSCGGVMARRVLKSQPIHTKESRGSIRVVLYKNGNRYTDKSVARLVATAFVPNPEGYKFVHQKDGDIHNNRADNLYWGRKLGHRNDTTN